MKKNSDCYNVGQLRNIIISMLAFVLILYYSVVYARYNRMTAVSMTLFIIAELIPVGFICYNMIEILEEKEVGD